jgi:murein DD-endopeptidase MepM/ murein hydrolase activator NlpD
MNQRMAYIKLAWLAALLLVALNCHNAGLPKNAATREPAAMAPTTAAKADADNPCSEFDRLNTLVRDGQVDRHTAREKIRALLPLLRAYFYAKGGADAKPQAWVFPLADYGPTAIGGTSGSGYIATGYDYFDGNLHRGHPAHDIFIHDKNQDQMDDATGKPVNVLSMSSGVVIACAKEWQPGSELRGGKYIFIYDPANNRFFYYAHNGEIFVEPGAVVKPGAVIATVGRSGKSAYAQRSPTHLHLMALMLEDGYPKPENLYTALLAARRVP